MSLTDEGRQFLEAAQGPLLGLHQALQTARQAKDVIGGPLRIVGPRSVFAPVLWPLLDEFCRRYPEVQPDVELDDRIGNWVEDRVDVGFRVGPSPAEGVIARRLFSLQLIICAAPSYLSRHGAPDSLGALAAHRCSAFRSVGTGRVLPWFVKVGDAVSEHLVTPALTVNDEALETEAVLAGHVIGLLTSVAAAPHIRSGRLIPLLVKHVADRSGVFVYYGSRSEQPARVRAFIDLAIERLADNPDFVLAPKELASAEAKGRAAPRRSL